MEIAKKIDHVIVRQATGRRRKRGRRRVENEEKRKKELAKGKKRANEQSLKVQENERTRNDTIRHHQLIGKKAALEKTKEKEAKRKRKNLLIHIINLLCEYFGTSSKKYKREVHFFSFSRFEYYWMQNLFEV